MKDRELLELAARAAGMQALPEGVEWPRESVGWFFCIQHGIPALHDRASAKAWRPLNDDGDALRLAVKLGIQVTPFLSGACAVATPDGWNRTESGYENGDTATRRAIVRAAAEIGRAMT